MRFVLPIDWSYCTKRLRSKIPPGLTGAEAPDPIFFPPFLLLGKRNGPAGGILCLVFCELWYRIVFINVIMRFVMYLNKLYFKSQLTTEQLMSRIQNRTKPWSLSSSMIPNRFLSKIKLDRFYLWKTTTLMMYSRASVPFCGRLIAREDGTLIVGRFRQTFASRVWFIIIFAFFWLVALINESFFPIIFFLVFSTIILFVIFERLSSFFFLKEESEILLFILNNLEAEQIEKEDTLTIIQK